MSTCPIYVRIIDLLSTLNYLCNRSLLVRPASYGSHFANANYSYEYKVVRFLSYNINTVSCESAQFLSGEADVRWKQRISMAAVMLPELSLLRSMLSKRSEVKA